MSATAASAPSGPIILIQRAAAPTSPGGDARRNRLLVATLSAMEQAGTTMRAYLGAAALIVGAFIVGISVVSGGIIYSYGGMFDSVRCIDPNVFACTGGYYYYGIPGIIPVLAGLLGGTVIVTGAVLLRRSFQRVVHGHPILV